MERSAANTPTMNPTALPPATIQTIREIVEAITATTGVTSEAMMGKRGTQRVSDARYLAMARIRWNTDLSLKEIGALFRRDHTSVIHACRAVRDRATTQPDLARGLGENDPTLQPR